MGGKGLAHRFSPAQRGRLKGPPELSAGIRRAVTGREPEHAGRPQGCSRTEQYKSPQEDVTEGQGIPSVEVAGRPTREVAWPPSQGNRT